MNKEKIILLSNDGHSLGISRDFFIKSEFGKRWNANKAKMKKSQTTIKIPFKLSSLYLFFFGASNIDSTENDFSDEINCLFYFEPTMIKQCEMCVSNFIKYDKVNGFSWVDVENTKLSLPFVIDLKIGDKYHYSFEYDTNQIMDLYLSTLFESTHCFNSNELIWTTYFLLSDIHQSEDLRNHLKINNFFQNLCSNFRADWLNQLYDVQYSILLNLRSLWIEQITDERIIEEFAQLFHDNFVDFDLFDPDCFNHFSFVNDFTFISSKYMKALLKISPHYIKILKFWKPSNHPICSCFLVDKSIIFLYLTHFDFCSENYPFVRELFEVFDSIGFAQDEVAKIISKFVLFCRNCSPPERISYQKPVKLLIIAEIGKQINFEPEMCQLNVLLLWLNKLIK